MTVTPSAAPTPRPTCGSYCTINENADRIPFKSSTFCTNLENGFVYDDYLFRSDVEKVALKQYCGMTCAQISSEVCGSDADGPKADEVAFDWTPSLFKSIFRDCCDGYNPLCSYCPAGTQLLDPDFLARNTRTTFNATCQEFVTYLDLEWWAHVSGETLDNYGPDSGNPSRSCNDLVQTGGPIWSPIREWESLSQDCLCVEPIPSVFPSRSPSSFPSTSPSKLKYPTLNPSFHPSQSQVPTNSPTEKGQCNPEPEQTFRSIGGIITGLYVAGSYLFLFYRKSVKAGRPRFGIQEMISEVGGQFTATVTGVGIIMICQNDDRYSSDEESGVIFSMTSLMSIDGFEFLLTMMTVPFMGPEDHPGETFDKARWNHLDGITMYLVRLLMWGVGCGLPLVTFFMGGLFQESKVVYILCSISLCLGIVLGMFGQCVLRKERFTGGGTRLVWSLTKQLVGVIPGMIIGIANGDWSVIGWGAELFIELSHGLAELLAQIE
ncbi:hypothetical protein ACHAXS_006722 [Conticribra weissflogii]